MPPVVALRPTTAVVQPPVRPAAAIVQPPLRPTVASPGKAVVCGVNGGSAEVFVCASAGGPGGSSPLASTARMQSFVEALTSSGECWVSLPPGGTLASVKLKVAPVADPCRPKIGTEDGDLVHLAPSNTDWAARGLGPLAVTVCKPLAFRVSTNTEKEIIHNSSVFESHGLICRFRGFWPSLP
ncbi:hypothetical protein SUGI_0979690 [Cryptomeria japonica]|nr:hypothetical protein SUGI_0979690 [Cryptomeria japonica]